MRRSVDEARTRILDEAERVLIERGPDAIRVQTVARAIGVTDAAVHYHFGSRDGLVEALVRRAGRVLRDELTRAVEGWDAGALDVALLSEPMTKTFRARGYARLAAWMALTGRTIRGSGIFRGLAEEVHARRSDLATDRHRTSPPLDDTLFAIELLTLVTWADAVSGDSWRRSVGLPTDQATRKRFLDWFAGLLTDHLRGPLGKENV